MPTVAVIALGVLGLAVLTVGADQLVAGSSRLATMLRIAPVVIGVVVIGLGTSSPEFLVSGVAAVQGNAGIAIGNLVGSNLINLTLVLGIAALVTPIVVRSSVPVREAPLTFGASLIFGAFAVFGLGLVAGVVLGVLAAAALLLLVGLSRVDPRDPLPAEVTHFVDGEDLDGPATADSPPTDGSSRAWFREGIRTVLGLAATLAGAHLVVSNAETLAQRWGVPETVIGYTLVAIGTSLPELVTAVQAQRHGESDLLVGNLLGSNLFNSLIGGSIVGVAAATNGDAIRVPYPAIAAMVAITMLAWLLLYRGYRISRFEATLLIMVYAGTLPLLSG